MTTKRQQTKDLLNAPASGAIDAQFGTISESSPTPQPEKPAKRAKDRITLRLYVDTLALLDALKIDARKNGRPANYGDVVEEAILDLAQKYGLDA